MSNRIIDFVGDSPLAYITHEPETISITVHIDFGCASEYASEGWPVSYLAPQLIVDDERLVALCSDLHCQAMQEAAS